MSALTEFLLSNVVTYGAPVFGLTLLVAAAGVPLPTTFLVVAAGAFSQQGIFDGLPAFLLGLVGAILGDSLDFWAGRYGRRWVLRRFGGLVSWHRAEVIFHRRGGLAIYLTRFLLTALALPINLIAGTSGYSFPRFLLYDVFGEATWLIVYGGLGYLFGTQWELVSDLISNFGGLALGIAILVAGVYLWHRAR
ncbi:MAG: DedA family protein [Anaerolineae bacterium]|nr:DedA family protein [Anaerolineae bacterium]